MCANHKSNWFYPTHREDFGSQSTLEGRVIYQKLFPPWNQGNARPLLRQPTPSNPWAEYIECVHPEWLRDHLKFHLIPPSHQRHVFTESNTVTGAAMNMGLAGNGTLQLQHMGMMTVTDTPHPTGFLINLRRKT
ncbi:hypothetical protein L9F63_003137 [Diploptera punctata]|uniref:Uncharacterized protein n=1 Tax=Diploptera punctata TaxID=6984 RepID=A0AAD8E9X0_DIPPU|nr:hypothetical protein L9F63_003137 [Diploptera punctata]